MEDFDCRRFNHDNLHNCTILTGCKPTNSQQELVWKFFSDKHTSNSTVILSISFQNRWNFFCKGFPPSLKILILCWYLSVNVNRWVGLRRPKKCSEKKDKFRSKIVSDSDRSSVSATRRWLPVLQPIDSSWSLDSDTFKFCIIGQELTKIGDIDGGRKELTKIGDVDDCWEGGHGGGFLGKITTTPLI